MLLCFKDYDAPLIRIPLPAFHKRKLAEYALETQVHLKVFTLFHMQYFYENLNEIPRYINTKSNNSSHSDTLLACTKATHAVEFLFLGMQPNSRLLQTKEVT